MRVTRIELRNIGPFDDAVLEIPEPSGKGEVVLFEGPNGSGKTTIAQAIAVAVGDAGLFDARGWSASPMGPSRELQRRLVEAEGSAHVALDHEGSSLRVGITGAGLDRSDVDRSAKTGSNPVIALLSQFHLGSALTAWAAFAFRGYAATADLSSPGPRDIGQSALHGALSFGHHEPSSKLLGQYLTNIEFDRVQAKVYALERPLLRESSRLTHLSVSREETLARFKHALSRVLDRQVDVDFPVGERSPRLRFDGVIIPLDLLGEGMRNTVSWLSDLLIRLERTPWTTRDRSPFDQDFWLILDEVEESLHPKMQARILPALRELFPNARIYATTHSPFVVASLGEGQLFAIRPSPITHRVTGAIAATPIEHGRSLEWVVETIFGAPTGFVDEATREKLEVHLAGVTALSEGGSLDWDTFLEARAWLTSLTDEVRALVARREAPVQGQIDEKLRERAT